RATPVGAVVLVRQLLPLPNCQRTNTRLATTPEKMLLVSHSARRGSRKRATADHPLNRLRGFALRKTPRKFNSTGPLPPDNPHNTFFLLTSGRTNCRGGR